MKKQKKRPPINIPDELWRDDNPVTEATNLVRLTVKMYRPRAVFCLCSGGNDSLCSTHVAMSTGLVTGVASINTTIGIQKTRDHMTMVAEKFRWPLQWFTPPMSYLALCERFGVPGPGGHDLVYQRLKERCIMRLVRENKKTRRDRIILITGCRTQESERRMGTSEPIQRDGSRVWVAPIINWSEGQKVVYQTDNGIPRNPVKAILGISGECLCGAFAKPGEREKIQCYFPDEFAHIQRCEAAAAIAGQHACWGTRPPKRKKQHLCQNCTRKNEPDEVTV